MQTKGIFLIPAYNAERHLGAVLRDLVAAITSQQLEGHTQVVVVDDGSVDATGAIAREAGAVVLRHEQNQGKGRALQTGLQFARDQGIEQVVTLDADGQHLPLDAVRLMQLNTPRPSLILGVRDLAAAGAPRPNQLSNRFSNWVLSMFGGERLEDTQCGLRRYPVGETLELGAQATGFAFESDVVLRAARRGLPIVHVPIAVLYPTGAQRVTHFDSVKDPARIVSTVVQTTLKVPHHRLPRRLFRIATIGLLLGGFAVLAFRSHT